MTTQIDTDAASAGSSHPEKSPAGGGKGSGGKGGGSGRAGPLTPYLPGRREAMFLIGGGVLGAALGAGALGLTGRSVTPEDRDDGEVLGEREGRERLEAGNARFVAGEPLHADQSVDRRDAITTEQAPFAAILSCADSQVPPELIFDQGLGDLYVVRSSGQVIDKAVLGSLQYGVEHLKPTLLVVLGHTECSAVKATVEAFEKKAKPLSSDIETLVTAIRPAVVEAEETGADKENLVSVSVDINVERIVDQLKDSVLLKEASTLRKVKIVGATYSVETGMVNWL